MGHLVAPQMTPKKGVPKVTPKVTPKGPFGAPRTPRTPRRPTLYGWRCGEIAIVLRQITSDVAVESTAQNDPFWGPFLTLISPLAQAGPGLTPPARMAHYTLYSSLSLAIPNWHLGSSAACLSAAR